MCKRCGNAGHIIMAAKVKDLEPELLRVAKLIHEGKMKAGDVDKTMIRTISQELMKAAFKGFGNSFDDELSAKDFSALKKIEGNVYLFSGFKNYQQVKESCLQLTDDEGALKPFHEFLADVKAIDETYNEVYLDAEWDTTISSAQGISMWEDFVANAKHSPNLTFRTSGGDVCPLCAPLDGLTYPIDHPFWDTYFIPIHYRCECDVEQNDDDVSNVSLSDLPELAPMFSTNVGKTGIIFPDTHPYFQDVSKADKKNVMETVKEVTPKRKYEGE